MPRTSGHYYPPLEPQPLLHTLLRATAIVTIFAVVLGAIYLSGGADPLVHWLEEKFFKAEAKAEAQVLEKAGSEKVEGLMKGESVFFSLDSPSGFLLL